MKVSSRFFDTIDDSNFKLFAAANYINPQCISAEEFYRDLRHIKAIRRQLTIYYATGKINVRLFLNNIIIFFNVFERDAAIVMLLHRVPLEQFGAIKAALHYLSLININIELLHITLDKQLYKQIKNSC